MDCKALPLERAANELRTRHWSEISMKCIESISCSYKSMLNSVKYGIEWIWLHVSDVRNVCDSDI